MSISLQAEFEVILNAFANHIHAYANGKGTAKDYRDAISEAQKELVDTVEGYLIPRNMPIGAEDEQPELDRFLTGDWRADKYSNMSAIRVATMNGLLAYQRNILHGKQIPIHTKPIELEIEEIRKNNSNNLSKPL